MKKIYLLLLFGFILFMPVAHVEANSPPMPDSIKVYLDQARNEAIYVDLLVSPEYNPNEVKNEINPSFQSDYPELIDKEITQYNVDGWVSYNAYYENANHAHEYGNYTFAKGQKQEILAFKVVICDATGSVIATSQMVDMKQIEDDGYLTNIQFDMVKKEFTVHAYESPISGLFDFISSVFLALVLNILLIVFSTFIEVMVALIFKIKPIYKLVIINIFTQLVLNMGIILLKLPYLAEVMIMEIIIYLLEFLGVRYFIKDKRLWRTFWYVVTANTVTLGLGLLYVYMFNDMILK